MALNATTLSGAITSTQTSFGLVSVTGILTPNFTTGPTSGGNVSLILCEGEIMTVLAAPVGTTLPVVARGQFGTAASAHNLSAPVVSGNFTDFSGLTPLVKAFQVQSPVGFQGWSSPVAGANTNVATGPMFHLTGTVIMKTLTAPAGYIEGGDITIVFDGSAAGLTWDATGNIAVAGTATTAASSVTFRFDSGSGKWHPSRLA